MCNTMSCVMMECSDKKNQILASNQVASKAYINVQIIQIIFVDFIHLLFVHFQMLYANCHVHGQWLSMFFVHVNGMTIQI